MMTNLLHGVLSLQNSMMSASPKMEESQAKCHFRKNNSFEGYCLSSQKLKIFMPENSHKETQKHMHKTPMQQKIQPYKKNLTRNKLTPTLR